MKREIKFRAWDGRKMRYDVLAGHGDYVAEHEDDSIWWWHEPPKAIMQFTGLLDKNGKEIYEGDLPGDTYESGVVQWCDKCCGWSIGIAEIPGHCHQCDGDFMWLDFVDDVRSGGVEIIGNIHENPEPIK